ncbi:hypothetical protein [Streptomyces morookaense]|uniref:Uncharacterized protein n=1 Tax=Streptomyces morookaense TaxID=1970 RepID=A0A7Y7BAW2_STRMO|nr:hypothetical protein [Streptomyces morookaense]NVK82220.1 hypothetical protein [Streptomyces morookaense]GHF16772.1 hypothetical protein GCM10010359_17860 [Streptomyces morookaense]
MNRFATGRQPLAQGAQEQVKGLLGAPLRGRGKQQGLAEPALVGRSGDPQRLVGLRGDVGRARGNRGGPVLSIESVENVQGGLLGDRGEA